MTRRRAAGPAPDGLVVVSLDDALGARLPPVCVRTGTPAAGYAPVPVGRPFGAWWLLLVLGPVGWLALVLAVPRLRVTYVLRLPMSRRTFDRVHGLAVRRLWCTVLGIVGVGAASVLFWNPRALAVVAGAALVSLGVAAHAHLSEPWARPSATVDRGGRRVTLLGVHDAFVAAVVVAGQAC